MAWYQIAILITFHFGVAFGIFGLLSWVEHKIEARREKKLRPMSTDYLLKEGFIQMKMLEESDGEYDYVVKLWAPVRNRFINYVPSNDRSPAKIYNLKTGEVHVVDATFVRKWSDENMD